MHHAVADPDLDLAGGGGGGGGGRGGGRGVWFVSPARFPLFWVFVFLPPAGQKKYPFPLPPPPPPNLKKIIRLILIF